MLPDPPDRLGHPLDRSALLTFVEGLLASLRAGAARARSCEGLGVTAAVPGPSRTISHEDAEHGFEHRSDRVEPPNFAQVGSGGAHVAEAANSAEASP